MRKYFILSVLFLLVSSVLIAQSETKLQPFSFGVKGLSQTVDVSIMPAADNEALLKEDALHQDKSLPLRAGIGYSVAKTLDNSGRKDILDDGSMLWRAEFVSKGAIMTYLVFDNFNIPEEAQLFIYSPDRTQVFGPYKNSDVQSVGKLVTDDIVGDEVVVEYYEPADASFKGAFEIAAVMHVYRDFLHTQTEVKGPHGEAEGTCHIDVACPEASGWQNPVKSVVCISITAYVAEEGGWSTMSVKTRPLMFSPLSTVWLPATKHTNSISNTNSTNVTEPLDLPVIWPTVETSSPAPEPPPTSTASPISFCLSSIAI